MPFIPCGLPRVLCFGLLFTVSGPRKTDAPRSSQPAAYVLREANSAATRYSAPHIWCASAGRIRFVFPQQKAVQPFGFGLKVARDKRLLQCARHRPALRLIRHSHLLGLAAQKRRHF